MTDTHAIEPAQTASANTVQSQGLERFGMTIIPVVFAAAVGGGGTLIGYVLKEPLGIEVLNAVVGTSTFGGLVCLWLADSSTGRDEKRFRAWGHAAVISGSFYLAASLWGLLLSL